MHQHFNFSNSKNCVNVINNKIFFTILTFKEICMEDREENKKKKKENHDKVFKYLRRFVLWELLLNSGESDRIWNLNLTETNPITELTVKNLIATKLI